MENLKNKRKTKFFQRGDCAQMRARAKNLLRDRAIIARVRDYAHARDVSKKSKIYNSFVKIEKYHSGCVQRISNRASWFFIFVYAFYVMKLNSVSGNLWLDEIQH